MKAWLMRNKKWDNEKGLDDSYLIIIGDKKSIKIKRTEFEVEFKPNYYRAVNWWKIPSEEFKSCFDTIELAPGEGPVKIKMEIKEDV